MEIEKNIYAPFYIKPVNPNKINIRNYISKGQRYKIWNYEKKILCFDEKKDIRQCRSLILSEPENELLSYSHGKSMEPKVFMQNYSMKDVYINEYIDGTLVHLFYDKRMLCWEIASKNAIGGNYTLFNKKKNQQSYYSLLVMFLEAIQGDNFSYKTERDLTLNNAIFENFPKNYCYSFVLMHPHNNIIFQNEYPKLYLVSIFDISKKENKAIHIPPFVFESWDCFQNTTILFPRTTNSFQNWNQMEDGQFEYFNEHESICGYHAIDLVTGERSIFLNPIYKELLRFQSMEPKSMFHYLCLRRTFQIKQYLEFFPKFRKRYKVLKDHFDSFIHNLHQTYLTKYILKIPILGKNKYVQYVESIHRDIYIKSLSQGEKKPITRKVVHDYIMTKHPGEILYILFTEKRNITKIA